MHSNEFKAVLLKLILQHFQLSQHASFLKGRKLYYTLDNNCFLLLCLNTNTVEFNEVQQLYCDHEEPDTKDIFYASKMPRDSKLL